MEKILVGFALACFCCMAEPNPTVQHKINKSDKQFSVVAYLPEWRYESANYDTICQYTTHLIFFSVEPDDEGNIVGRDRFPPPDVLVDARVAALKHGCKLLICFGGNGRSNGFSKTVSKKESRDKFAKKIAKLIKQYGLDGVDINWEYPGYQFGRGYGSNNEIQKDYTGLIQLLKRLRQALGQDKVITLAYYPDIKQEQLLKDGGAERIVDLMHMMTYDQSSGHHSDMNLATKSIDQALRIGLTPPKLTLGLPFYGRHSKSGEWTTYEDIVQKAHPLPDEADEVFRDKMGFIGFNGKSTITEKVKLAVERGIGGVMIWEVGQDCRLEAVSRFGRTHGVTCPRGDDSSLLVAISKALLEKGIWTEYDQVVIDQPVVIPSQEL